MNPAAAPGGGQARTDGTAPRRAGRSCRVRELPGGASVEEEWSSADHVTVRITGELDAFDRSALIDLLTGCFAAGGRDIVIDADQVGFADLAVIRTLDRLRAGLERAGGTLQIVGLDRIRDLLVWLPSARQGQSDAGALATDQDGRRPGA